MTFCERRERIQQILRRKGHVTCGELAECLGVSKNTVLHDIDAITMIFPIASEYGRYGGYLYCGNGVAELNASQTKYIYEFMCRYAEEVKDEMFNNVLEILRRAVTRGA